MIKYEPYIKRRLDALPSGKLRYTLKNDYMFKAVLQKNQTALAGLLSALLKIPVSQIESITILNPIELGKSYDAKDCMLDIKLKLNNARIINIELQIEEGFIQGKQEGQLQLLILQICRKLQKHKTPEMISEDLEEDLALVQHICHVAEKFAPDYNTDEIYAACQEEYQNQQKTNLLKTNK